MEKIENFKKEYYSIQKDVWDLKRRIATMESARIEHNEKIMRKAIDDVIKTTPHLSVSKAGYTIFRKGESKTDFITVYIIINGFPSAECMGQLEKAVRSEIDNRIIRSISDGCTVVDVEVSSSDFLFWTGAKLI